MKLLKILQKTVAKIQDKNKSKLLKAFLVLALLLPILFSVFLSRNIEKKEQTRIEVEVNTRTYFDEKTFMKGIEYAKNQKTFSEKVFGGIIPQHQLPGFIIAQFFKGLKNQKPKTIILLGPNHYETGNFYALTSNNSWPTPYGYVIPNKEIINELTSYNFVQIDNNSVANDHSMGTSMPFIKYYLPDTQVVPIILSGKMTQKETENLASVLSTLDLPIIASVDFSHYLTSVEAQKKDSETLRILETFNIERLFSLNNDYLDSPPSIATLLYSIQKMGKTNFKILQNTNSGILTNDHTSPTTSYFSIIYY